MTAENIRKFNQEYNNIADGMNNKELDARTRNMMSDELNGMAKAVALLGGRIIPCPCCGRPTLEIDGLTSCSDDLEALKVYNYLKAQKTADGSDKETT